MISVDVPRKIPGRKIDQGRSGVGWLNDLKGPGFIYLCMYLDAGAPSVRTVAFVRVGMEVEGRNVAPYALRMCKFCKLLNQVQAWHLDVCSIM